MESLPFLAPSATVRVAAACLAVALIGTTGHAAELKEARVTQVVKDVKLLPGQAAPRPAAVNETVRNGTAVRTGLESRSELTFNDQTITRLGANTIFSFTEGTRNMDLKDGAMLLRVPKNVGGAKITSAAVTAAITGTTVMFEAHPFIQTAGNSGTNRTSRANGKTYGFLNSKRLSYGSQTPATKTGYYKFICLEGTARLYDPNHVGESVLVQAGQMVIGQPGQPLSNPVDVDIKKILQSSLLITGFGPLGSESLMSAEVNNQTQEKSDGQLYNTNLAIYGGGTNIVLGDPTNINIVQQATNAQNPPNTGPTPPGKFGPPPQIPGNYQISSATQVSNETQITTSGATNYGTIYRTFAQDGLRSLFFFGSTRNFDTQSGFDLQTQPMFNLNNIAVFKFDSLQLVGNPTITIPGGGVTKLALIGVNGITSGAPGGALSFTGLDTLLLTTQSGSIVLGSEVSFQNIQNLIFYARGTNAALTIGSPITGTNLLLNSEGTVQVNGNTTVTNFTSFSGGDYLNGSGIITAKNIAITSVNGNVNVSAARFPDTNGAGGGITLTAPIGAINLDLNGSGQNGYGWNTFTATANTINVFATDVQGPKTFKFTNSPGPITLTAGSGGINADTISFFGHNLTLNSGGDIAVYDVRSVPDQNENLILDGSIFATGSLNAMGDVESGTVRAVNGNINVGGALTAGAIKADSGSVNATNGMTAVGGSITAGTDINSANGDIQLQADPATNGFGNITAGRDINAGGGIYTPGDPVVVQAGRDITASAIITGTLDVGRDLYVGNPNGGYGFGIIANTILVNGTAYFDNLPTISPNNGGFGGNDGGTFDDFSMTVGSIVSTGPTYAVLSSNGGDANANFSDSNPGNGGKITLTITGGGLSIGDGNELGAIEARGGAFNPGGPFGGGNGGTVDLTVAGDVLIENRAGDNAGITATTGIVSDVTSQYAGNGGTVNVTAAGQISVNGNIKVSSDDATQLEASGSGRESASGGAIDLQSNLTTGSGITITANGGLLSYLNPNAPGPGGSITLSTMGADITVNGTIEADQGTIAIDQNDPSMGTPAITIDGATLTSNVLNITGIGDLNIAASGYTTLHFSQGTWTAANNVNWNVRNTTLSPSIDFLNVTAGSSIYLTGANIEGTPASLNLNLTSASTLTAQNGDINATGVDIFFSGADLNLVASGNIYAHTISFTDSTVRGNVNAGGAISLTGDLSSGGITAGTTIGVSGNVLVGSMTAGSDITVGGRLAAFGDITSTNGNVTAGTFAAHGLNASNGVLTVGSGGITPFIVSPGGAAVAEVYNVGSIVSPNGLDFSGNQFNGIDGLSSGGSLTINANTLTFDSTTGIGNVNFNGADAGAFSGGGPSVAGNGGIFIVNAVNDLTINSDIEASTGNVSGGVAEGTGGTVSLNSANGTVSVSSTIQVSHAGPTPGRSSAKGGNIILTSGKKSGVAINVANTAQLLALLDAAAPPGNGGTITITAGNPAQGANNSGNNSAININGTLVATNGTMSVSHYGDGGSINITGGQIGAQMSADVIKAQVYGTNGSLNIGGNSILSAGSVLNLYASGANGTVNFIGNCTLAGNSLKTIWGDTVNVASNVVVTVSGPTATIYTNNANYSSTYGGGNNSTNGAFKTPGGTSGATTILNQKPPGT